MVAILTLCIGLSIADPVQAEDIVYYGCSTSDGS